MHIQFHYPLKPGLLSRSLEQRTKLRTTNELTYSYISLNIYLPLFPLLLLLKSKNIYLKQKFSITYIKYIYEAFMCIKIHKIWCAFLFGMNSLITKPRNQLPVSSACCSPSLYKITKSNTLSQVFCMFSNTAHHHHKHILYIYYT